MSSLLEQAIIDATQLREAALKSAESTVTEKYSDEIKSVMSELLAEAEEDFEMIEDPELAIGEPEALETPETIPGAEADVPPAALDGETACPCPDDVEGDGEDTMYTLDLDRLVGAPSVEPGQESAADFAAGVAAGTLEEDNDEEINLELEEEIEFSAEDLVGLLEDLEVSVDAGSVPSGWLGTPEAEKADQINRNLAALKDTEEGEENKELMKKLEELDESNKRISTEAQEYKNLAENLAENLKRVNTSNAKLLYINKTLGSTSLNERQRKTIVEAITKASTAEEAKVIFETLQNTVGSAQRREPLPQSLSEAVNRKTPAMLISHPRRTVQDDDNGMNSFANRMRKLAGIT